MGDLYGGNSNIKADCFDFIIVFLIKNPNNIAINIPNIYRIKTTDPAAAPKKKPPIIIYIGNLAPQEMNGFVNIVILLSILSSIVLAAIIAGTLHPNPTNMGITDFPCSPSLTIALSKINAARLRYPLSSKNERNKKSKKIFGTKARIIPIPLTIPSPRKDPQISNGLAASSCHKKNRAAPSEPLKIESVAKRFVRSGIQSGGTPTSCGNLIKLVGLNYITI